MLRTAKTTTRQGPETDSRQGVLLYSSNFLPSFSPLCLHLNKQAPVSPLGLRLQSPSLHLFLIILLVFHIPPSTFCDCFVSHCLCLNRLDKWQQHHSVCSGVRAFPYYQHAGDSSHCLSFSLLTPWKHQ